MQVRFHTTRNSSEYFSSSQCILKGLGDDGGLFISDEIKNIKIDINDICGRSYQDTARLILSELLTDFTDEQIDYCVEKAYNHDNFDTEDIFTLSDMGNFGFLELYHGKTIAFKDAALSILPHLMKCSFDNTGTKEKTLILTATSGDTGKAALEGFKNAEGIDVIVFYPYGGVSKLQLLQMLTQEGENVTSFAVKGNFDDCQSAVKEIFNDYDFNKKVSDEYSYVFSSANSINIGRLIPQIVYYFYAYAKAVEKKKIVPGEPIDFIVPTGNFGNILAGYYAGKMGLPVGKLICASNENNVLTDFFNTGKYDKKRTFVKTIAPSMDILISSNLERLIYEIEGSAEDLARKMKELSDNGEYTVDTSSPVLSQFMADYSTEDEIKKGIKDCYDKYGYLIDTHTATGYNAYERIGDKERYTVILSTASAYKFSKDVYSSLFEGEFDSDIDYMYKLSEMTSLPIPPAVDKIEERPRKEEKVIAISEMRDAIINRLGERK